MFTTGTGSDVYRKDNLFFDFRLILALSRSGDDILTRMEGGGGERLEDMFRNPRLKSSRILLLVVRQLCSQMQIHVGINVWYFCPPPRKNPEFQMPGVPPPVPAPIGVTFYTSSHYFLYILPCLACFLQGI